MTKIAVEGDLIRYGADIVARIVPDLSIAVLRDFEDVIQDRYRQTVAAEMRDTFDTIKKALKALAETRHGLLTIDEIVGIISAELPDD